MNVITQETLQTIQPNQQISGILLVTSYNVQLTKNGKEYIAGNLQSGITVPFKAWGNSSAFGKLKNEEYQNVPSYIVATVDGFGGTNSLIIDSIQAVDGYTPDQFFPIRYNIDAYWEALKTNILKKVSEKGLKICNEVLFENAEVADRFKKEFAAMSYHDNCKGGLLAHTYKVVSNTANIIAQYPDLCKRDGVANQDFIDLLMIGALLHDIGKTVEMQFGVYQPVSIVTHTYLGMEFIAPFKQSIIEAYDEMWYYNLTSILLQHHGEFGEPCRTIAAFIIHKADEYDASLTLLAQYMEGVNNVAGSRIKVDGSYLTI